jgi:Sortase domain
VIDRLAMLQRRLVPAVLTAVGVSLLAAGILAFTGPAAAMAPGPSPTAGASTDPSASAIPSQSSASPGPRDGSSSEPSASPRRVATRVVVPALRIDLPVIAQPGGASTFPACNVAMYLAQLHQPGEAGATYLYAHARVGMFLPILQASWVNNGKAMLGMIVQVYTSDDQLFLYEIVAVRRHVTTLDTAFAETAETLWLQTSEGPVGTNEKTQLIARPLSSGPADHADSHPTPRPVACS